MLALGWGPKLSPVLGLEMDMVLVQTQGQEWGLVLGLVLEAVRLALGPVLDHEWVPASRPAR